MAGPRWWRKRKGRTEIDHKLANYAFVWVNTPIAPHAEAPEGQQAVQHKIDNPVEFPVEFQLKGTTTMAVGLLRDTRPWQQCTVAIKTGDLQSPMDYFEFFNFLK